MKINKIIIILIFIIHNFLVFSQTTENNKNFIKINRIYYTCVYDDSAKYTIYSGGILCRYMVKTHKAKRHTKFMVDSNVKNCSENSDFVGTPYAKGQLVDAQGMRFSDTAEKECCYLTNISPQLAAMNRGIWKKLEIKIRYLVLKYDTIEVYSGGIIDSPILYIGKNHIPVPNKFYKIIYIKNQNMCYAFIFYNIDYGNNNELRACQTNLNTIYIKTHIKFFSDKNLNGHYIFDLNE